MDELKLEPDSEENPSPSIIRKPGTSGTFIEMAPSLAVIKVEPKEETDMEPDGIIDPEPDDEQDPLGLNIKRDDAIVGEEDLPCPLAFLAIEIKAEDDTRDDAQAAKEVEIDGARDLNDVGKMTWTGHVKQKRGTERPGKYVNMTEEKLAEKREKNRLRKRRYRAAMSEEVRERERERNRLSMKKRRASRKIKEEIKRQTEIDMAHKKMPELSGGNDIEKPHTRSRKSERKPRVLTPQQLELYRERNRTYMRKFRASLSAEELEWYREKDRLRKRRAREVMNHPFVGLNWTDLKQFHFGSGNSS